MPVPAPHPMKPSELNANASRFNGQTIAVRGYVRIVPEGHNLYESKELDEAFGKIVASGGKDFRPAEWNKYCLTIANPGPLYKHEAKVNGQTLTLTGKFMNDYLKPNMIDIGACPQPTAIVVDYSDLQKRYPLLFK